MKILEIKTKDPKLLDALYKARIPGVTVWYDIKAPADISAVTDLVTFGIEFGHAMAAGLLVGWLFEYLKKNKPHKTTINGHQITNNIQQLTVIVQQQPQQAKRRITKKKQKKYKKSKSKKR
jgi:hypothetical protein